MPGSGLGSHGRSRGSGWPRMWDDQAAAAIRAVSTRSLTAPVRCGRVSWHTEGRFLYCTLPSGRRLAYPDPEVHKRPTPWGEDRNALTFMGINTYTRKWERQHTYGGSCVENQCQAVARDILAEAMIRCEHNGFPVVATIHDEVIAEAKTASNLQEFTDLVAACPPWAKDLPIAVEAWTGRRYKK